MNDPNLQRAAHLDTATLSDAMDKLGIAGQCRGIKPRDHSFRMTGRAYSILYGPLDAEKPGNGRRLHRRSATWHRSCARQRRPRRCHRLGRHPDRRRTLSENWQGRSSMGRTRDVHLALSLGYPIYSRSYSMRTGKDRVQVDAVQVPVNIGDARVLPGRSGARDADGVVVIPRSREEEVLDIAEHIEASEQQIRSLVESGLSLREAREKLQYHKLQSK